MAYIKLEDSYSDIKGATLNTLNRNKEQYKLPINQAVAYFMNELEGVFEENEFEKVITLIPVCIFLVENKFKHKILEEVNEAVEKIESNKYKTLFLKNEDIEQVEKDIKFILKESKYD